MAIPIGEFIRHPRFGIKNIVFVLNRWHERLQGHPATMLLRYEDLRSDTPGELERLLHFCGFEDVDTALVQEAVDFAAFENMKKMEAKGAFSEQAMKPADSNDPASFKVREGKVGGYAKHFTEDELRYLDEAVGELDGYLGYSATVSQEADK